ncbi:MAG: pseudouridine synthase [Parasporobacterium sp.]|nr:pseudouridine synthase [Parasporobacterium sp.]
MNEPSWKEPCNDTANRAETVREEVRLNKYLSDAGVCSRREADRRIQEGRIRIDGKTAVLGQKVLPGQQVFCDGKPVTSETEKVILAFHKPVGVECTTASNVRNNIIDFIHYKVRIFPVGRLDKNSSGLILLTNRGELSDQILRGSNYHEKEYLVSVDRRITGAFLQKMREGVEILMKDGTRKAQTRPCEVEQTGERSFRIILTQGLNRQIRRMCQALGYQVLSLKRIRIMNVLLGDLPEGEFRTLTDEEIRELELRINRNRRLKHDE